MAEQSFGGEWTRRKLAALEAYVDAYLKVMSKQGWAELIYLDGFAGSGGRWLGLTDDSGQSPFADMVDVEFEIGSALRVISNQREFHKYVFVEANRKNAQKLSQRVAALEVERQYEIHNVDINVFLQDWCPKMQDHQRCVLFLDPYGMQVQWKSLEAIAKTRKIDLCVLIPINGLDRVLPRAGSLEMFESGISKFLGTDEWKSFVYGTPDSELDGLFAGMEHEADLGSVSPQKVVKPRQLADYIVNRMKTIFADVPADVIELRNSRGHLLFILCLAVSNERAIPIATRVFRSIKRSQERI